MSGRGRESMQATPTVLLADADVLIDYRDSELAILNLVARHLGRVAVISSVLDEVRGVTATECARLGVDVIDVETDRMLQAAEIESGVSFNDRLCLIVCREEGWTCVTNDGALRRLCKLHDVKTRFGLVIRILLAAQLHQFRENRMLLRSLRTSVYVSVSLDLLNAQNSDCHRSIPVCNQALDC